MTTIAQHCSVDLYGCPDELLDDEVFVRNALREAIEVGSATLVGDISHHFHPQGVTALALIAESHVAVHTWPEYNYATIDILTCTGRTDASRICSHLASALRAVRTETKHLSRGELKQVQNAAESAATMT